METVYDFDEVFPRRGTHATKWDAMPADDIIPMWVADMDFRTFPGIIQALQAQVAHGIFGYAAVPESYYRSVMRWFSNRHGWNGLHRDHFIVVPGVVPAISAIVRALTLPGDKVIVQTPVYNCFFSSIRNQGCQIEENRLVYADNTYTIDWDDFEQKCSDARARIFILCNPHNPAGRVWTRQELQRMGEICRRHHVFVIADEIHGEIVMPGNRYLPYASIDETLADNCAVCVASTKAFNIAGLQIANIIVKNPDVRERIDRAVNIHEVCDVNPFGLIATEAAYTEDGAAWLDQLNRYIADNYACLKNDFAGRLPQFPVTKLEGTYLVWLNCAATGKPSQEIAAALLNDHRVWVNEGEMYGDPTNSFIRINIACPRRILVEGLSRIADGLQKML